MIKMLSVSVFLFLSYLSFAQPSPDCSLSKSAIYELTNQPVDLQNLLVRSDNLMREGQSEQAILVLDEAIATYPNYPESYLKRAEQLSKIGRLTEARMDLQAAYRLHPTITRFLQSKGKLDKLRWIAFPEEEYFHFATTSVDSEVGEFIVNSLEKKKAGDLVGAMIDLDLAFLLHSEEEAKLYSLKGNLLLLSRNFEEATLNYSKAIELAPNTAYLFFNRGVSRLFSNERSKAGEDLERSEALGYKIPHEKLSYFCYY